MSQPQKQLYQVKREPIGINNGGMNSVHEGLFFHVPLVVVPQTLEQKIVALQVVRLEAGVLLEKEQVSAESLRAAAEQVMGDAGFERSAERAGESFRAAR